jgi:hypothetical protein
MIFILLITLTPPSELEIPTDDFQAISYSVSPLVYDTYDDCVSNGRKAVEAGSPIGVTTFRCLPVSKW